MSNKERGVKMSLVAKVLCVERMKSLINSRESFSKEQIPHKTLFEAYQNLEIAFIETIEAEAKFLISISKDGEEHGKATQKR